LSSANPETRPNGSDGPKNTMLTRFVDTLMRGDVAVLLVLVSLALGAAALYLTPREEEPQIVVPMADVFITAPGLSARQVEEKVTSRLEKLLYQIDGVEYIYSMSRPAESVVTVRFFVGEDREDSLVKLYNKIHSNTDQIPPSVESWVVKPIEVDDVPIVNVTLWSDRPRLYSDHELRRIAEQLQYELKSIRNTNRVSVVGGRPRQIRVLLDPVKLAGADTSAFEVLGALKASNVQLHVGDYEQQDREIVVESGKFVRDAQELGELVIAISGGRPVRLKDVATIIDGPAEADSYSWIGFGPAAENPEAAKDVPALENPPPPEAAIHPAVHLAVAKRRGANAVWVAEAVEERMQQLKSKLLPEGVHFRITRDYGETADAKVNELVKSLVIAVLTVIGLIGLVMGWRTALVVALAVPVCYSATLFVNLLLGYTINRVTLFALILALGLLVDDPITGVENIARFFGMRRDDPRRAVLLAVEEVQPPLILSTLAIIASFLPLMFITGMMGPYMAPMALNVPLTVTVSTLVALMITPWLAFFALPKPKPGEANEQPYDARSGAMYRISQAILGPILDRRWLSWATLGLIALLLVAVMILPATRRVPLKMLPYDNKNEFQIVVDMPEGTTLERTDAVTRQLAAGLAGVAEVRDFQLYVGQSSPMDFNGMVRHYFLRRGGNVADIRVNLAPKERREQQSHVILLRIRDMLEETVAGTGAKLKLVEVPPGPPVLATITAEVYGPREAGYDQIIAAARRVEKRMRQEPGVVDVDLSAEDDQPKVRFVVDKEKAALSGVSTEDVTRALRLALDGMNATVLQRPGEVDPLWVELRLQRSKRSASDDLEEIYVKGRGGQMVQVGALGEFVDTTKDGQPLLEDKSIYRKNLRRVVFVYGEVAGRPPADAIVDMQMDRLPDERGTGPFCAKHPPGRSGKRVLSPSRPASAPRPLGDRTWLEPGGGVSWAMPEGFEVVWAGEGEWKITLDVFRDLGLAFAAALVGIFVILMFQTGSRTLPLVIMLAIPLTMIGIMPGFWLLNLVVDRPIGPSGYPNPVFFTATAMIGMIALAGIVVRNSVVLIEFINQSRAEGLPVREALVQSVSVRARPILLTAGTTLLGNWVITLDPIFSGLAWAVIFGILTSTVFTLVVIPVVYWLLYGREERARP